MKIIYTTAEKAYDGFSTRTIEEGKYITGNKKPIRKVEMEDRDYDWQTMRYASGMNMCATEEEFKDLLGWFIKKVKS